MNGADQPATDLPIREILTGGDWIRDEYPFPHYRAMDVFRDHVYSQMAEEYAAIQKLGLSETAQGAGFVRRYQSYDAYAAELPDDPRSLLRIFVSRKWHDLLQLISGVSATGDVSAALHYHAAGSADGQVHNDLNPGWFAGTPKPNDLILTDECSISYNTGAERRQGILRRENVRAATMIFFLNNTWTQGAGGETGLYRRQSDAVDQAATKVPPINNSLLLFECTPYSYHTFLSNRLYSRSSVILWLHRTKTEAVARWGESQIVRW